MHAAMDRMWMVPKIPLTNKLKIVVFISLSQSVLETGAMLTDITEKFEPKSWIIFYFRLVKTNKKCQQVPLAERAEGHKNPIILC